MFFLMFESKTLLVTFAFSLILRVYRYIISDDVYGLFKMNLGYSIYQVLEYEWTSLCPNIIEGLALTISYKKSRLSSSYFQIVSWLRLSCKLIPSTFVLFWNNPLIIGTISWESHGTSILEFISNHRLYKLSEVLIMSRELIPASFIAHLRKFSLLSFKLFSFRCVGYYLFQHGRSGSSIL